MLGDHLGSTSLTTNASGQVISEIRYKAWGETRYAAGVQPTKYQYTGQFSYEPEFGLYFYNARWYDPYLSHFTQPDTIVPDQYNSLDWNRYSYARNNPVRYTDPSGHVAISDSDGGGSLEQTLLFFKKYGKHKDQFNELYATIYFAEESLADALRDGQLSESEAMELETYEKLIQQERDSAFNNLSQDEFGQLKRFSSAPNLLKRATDRAEIIDGFVVSVQPSPSDEDIFGASLAAAGVVVVFGHGARHLVGLNVTQAEVEAAIRNDIALTVNSASQTGPFWGRVTINGQVIEYRAYPIGNNTINVGTYYDPENK